MPQAKSLLTETETHRGEAGRRPTTRKNRSKKRLGGGRRRGGQWSARMRRGTSGEATAATPRHVGSTWMGRGAAREATAATPQSPIYSACLRRRNPSATTIRKISQQFQPPDPQSIPNLADPGKVPNFQILLEDLTWELEQILQQQELYLRELLKRQGQYLAHKKQKVKEEKGIKYGYER